MHRHMQNLSFFAILTVLLGCAFFFSQQTELGDDARLQTSTPDKPLEDIPNCDDIVDESDASDCFTQAVQISEQWMEYAENKLLAQETAVDERMAFTEAQLIWEDSRDADCEFLHRKSDTPHIANLKQSQCLLSHNLARLEVLESYLCDLYGSTNCKLTEMTAP